MDIDFHEKYKGYSNIELLKILRRPNEYQVAAVDAATRSLLQEKFPRMILNK